MTKVQNILLNNLIDNVEKIESIQKFKKGYLNDNYLVTLKNNQKYVVRICNPNDFINRAQEYDFMNAINVTNQIQFYDLKTGDYIRNYHFDSISSKQKRCYQYLNQIIQQIQTLHNNPITEQIKKIYDFEMYVNLSKKNGDKYFELYKKIIKQIQNNPSLKLCLSHNDLNPANIMATNQSVNFIDFEFSCLNYDYFDYGYFFKEIFIKNRKLIKLSKQYHWDYQLMLSFIYLTTYISYAWSKQMIQTKPIIKYQKMIFKRLNYYYKLVSKL